jgi:proteasome accessory factor C
MARPTAEVRLARLLSVIPWIVERDGATIAEIAQQFGIPEDEVLTDLSLVQCCEIPPYGPDHTLGIVVVDDEVVVEPGAMLGRPLRLDPQEAFGLLAAGRAATAVLGNRSGSLATALDKLDRALGDRSPVSVDLVRPDAVDDLETAVRQMYSVDIDYYTASRDALTSRRVDPVNVLNHDGDWFLHAWCHLAEAMRTFRVDRIESLTPTTESFELPDTVGSPRLDPGSEGQIVTLALDPEAMWVVEAYPTVEVTLLPKGGATVSMSVFGDVFLERVLLRAGTHARVIAPPELVDVGRTAAQRLLANYAQ